MKVVAESEELLERALAAAGGELPAGEKEEYVRDMFNAIAHHYDMMNLVMTAGCYRLWQRAFLRLAAPAPDQQILDVACGTADLSILLATQLTTGKVVGIDLAPAMLAVGAEKVRQRGLSGRIQLLEGNALDLSFADGCFDMVTIGFGLRNITDRSRAVAEMARVLRPGGRFLCLELTHPTNPVLAAPYFLYFRHVVPLLGRLFERGAGRGAYTYLPNSLRSFPAAADLAALMANCGLTDVTYKTFTGGIVALHSGRKPL